MMVQHTPWLNVPQSPLNQFHFSFHYNFIFIFKNTTFIEYGNKLLVIICIIFHRLPNYGEGIIDKTLALVSHLIVSNSHLINQDQKVQTSLSHAGATSLRSKETLWSVSVEPSEDGQDEIDNGYIGKIENRRKPLQFIVKLKTFLKSTNVNLKGYVLKHLKLMAAKLPHILQNDIFSKIIFPYFRTIFPVVDIRRQNVKITLSEPSNFISSYLELLLTYLKLSEEMVCLFYRFEGIEITKWLSHHDDEKNIFKSNLHFRVYSMA